MSALLKYKYEFIFGLVVLITYFLLRVPNLTAQPIFADEAIYIRWAQVMKAEPTLRFISVQDGKTPLYMWVMMPFLKFFEDPLFAGRILSVLSGVGTLLGVYFLARLIFNSRVAMFAAIFYAVSPYTVFFDRMALVDSMLAAFTIWALYFAILVTRYQRLDLAMVLGYLLGGGLLVKTPAMMNILVLPLTLIAGSYRNSKKSNLVRTLFCLMIAILIGLFIYNLLRLGPNFSQLSSRNEDYIFSLNEIFQHPLDPLVPHFRDVIEVFSKMLTISISFLLVLGMIFAIGSRNRAALVILIWALVPLFLQLVFLKVFTARYILFSIPPLLVLAGYGFDRLVNTFNKKHLTSPLAIGAFLILFIVPSLYSNYLLLTNYEKAPLPANEREGYLEEWTAGYGFKELANFIMDKRKEGTVVVGTEGFFGTLPDGLQIYLDKTSLSFVGSSATISAEIRTAAKDHYTLFVANKNRLKREPENAVLVKEYPKVKPLDGGAQDAIVVYQVFPN